MWLDQYFYKRKKEEIWYLRKVNAIHKWIVDNVQNWNDDQWTYLLEENKINELLTIINTVLKDKHQTVAMELLPTAEWFFFWSTDYDEYYYSWLEEAKEILERMINEKWEYYYSCWW
jgi:hypothetical protein